MNWIWKNLERSVKMALRHWLACVICFTVLAVPGRGWAQLDRDTVLFLGQVLLGREYDIQNMGVTVRWETAPKLSTFGSLNHHRSLVGKVVADINRCLPENRKIIMLEPNDETANLEVYFLPKTDYEEKAQSLGLEAHVRNWGMFHVRWSRQHVIQQATVILSSDRLTAKKLRHFMLEEIVQSLGVAGDSDRFPESVFYENQQEGDYGSARTLTELDCRTLRFLYEHVPPGTSAIELGMLLERHWRQ